MAKIYLTGGTEHTLIPAVREAFVRPFQATDWVDLRVGFFLSLCGNADPGEDGTITGLGETIPNPSGHVPWTDRVAIGITDRATGGTFCGYSNLPHRARLISLGDSILTTSDIGIGTATTYFWRPKHGTAVPNGDVNAVHIIDGGQARASAPDGSQMHFVQETVGASGYCTLFMLRFTRDNATNRARIITMEVKKATAGGHSSDVLFNSDPSNTVLESQLEDFPTSVNTLGPVELSHVPDTFYFYWPFSSSRLRIHGMGILKQA